MLKRSSSSCLFFGALAALATLTAWSPLQARPHRTGRLVSSFSKEPSASPKVSSEGDAGATKVNPVDGAEMVYVPAGSFVMGADPSEIPDATRKYFENAPRRRVTLSGFWIYKNVVTVAQYRAFCNATGYSMPIAPAWGWKDDNPIVDVSWYDAMSYARWAGVALPTEAQWEKAARGSDGRAYPWGNQWDPALCVHSKSNLGDLGGTRKVGSCPGGASPYGVLDMAGNVWQWCADWYDQNYWTTNASRTSDPVNQSTGAMTTRVLRGGSWYDCDSAAFRSPFRLSSTAPRLIYCYIGFRCCSR